MTLTITHDPQAQAVYIRLRDAAHQTTRQIDEDVLIDLDADGNVIGIEITHQPTISLITREPT